MGWKDSEGNITNYSNNEIIVAVSDLALEAQFLSEAEYDEACQNLIEGNEDLITVSTFGENPFFIENGALVKNKFCEESVGVCLEVTGEVQGTKYLAFDLYDPKGRVNVRRDREDGVYDWFDGSQVLQSCSIELAKGDRIWISDYYAQMSSDAYIKNLRIVDGIQEIKIGVASADKSMGTVAGGGTVEYGTPVKVKATPVDGYELNYWKDAQGNIVSYENSFTVKAVKDAVYTAVFHKTDLEKESIAAILNDEDGVVKKISMEGGEWTLNSKNILQSPGLYESSARLGLTVEIPEGKCYEFQSTGNFSGSFYNMSFVCLLDNLDNQVYEFINSDAQYTTNEPITLTSGTHTIWFEYGTGTADAESAKLKKIVFKEKTGKANIEGSIRDSYYREDSKYENYEIEGLGEYEIGENITLKAPSIPECFFYGWSKDYEDISMEQEITIQVEGDATYLAIYGEMPKGFVDESIFTLYPKGKWEFWDNAYSDVYDGELSVSFTVDENDTKILYFEGGADSDYSKEPVSVYVDGVFYGFYGEQTENGEMGFIPFTSGEHTVKWAYSHEYWPAQLSNISLMDEEELSGKQVKLHIDRISNGGNCEISGNGIYDFGKDEYGRDKYGTYDYGTVVTLAAEPDEGTCFIGWGAPDGTFSKEKEITVAMDKCKTYKAYYVSDDCAKNYFRAVATGNKYEIEFQPSMWQSGYSDIWAYSGWGIPYSPLCATVNIPAEEKCMLTFDCSMNFNGYNTDSQAEGDLIVYVNGKEQLRVSYDPAEPNTTYCIPLSSGENQVKWSFVEKDNLEEEWSLGLSNINVKAAKYYVINATSNNEAYGTVTGGGKYTYNQNVTLKAEPKTGYVFKAWEVNGKVVSTESEYKAAVIENVTYTAVFEKNGSSGDDQEDGNPSGGNQDDTSKGDENGNNDKDENGNTSDENKETHTHTAGEWVTTKEATAKEAGLKVKTCTICGCEMEQEVIPKYEVSFNVKGTIPLQLKKSTTAIKPVLMAGDKVKSYKSSNTKVAKVNKKGKITARKTGKAKITVTTQKGATATITIKVQKNPVKTKKITTDTTNLTLEKGQSYTLSVTKTPITSLEKVTFKTSNKKVATVNKKGKIKAKKKGKATITVKCGKKTKKVKVTVK